MKMSKVSSSSEIQRIRIITNYQKVAIWEINQSTNVYFNGYMWGSFTRFIGPTVSEGRM